MGGGHQKQQQAGEEIDMLEKKEEGKEMNLGRAAQFGAHRTYHFAGFFFLSSLVATFAMGCDVVMPLLKSTKLFIRKISKRLQEVRAQVRHRTQTAVEPRTHTRTHTIEPES